MSNKREALWRIFKCPCCKGKGGYTEPILDFGIGPYYQCDFCDDWRKVAFPRWFLWFRTVTLPEFAKRNSTKK